MHASERECQPVQGRSFQERKISVLSFEAPGLPVLPLSFPILYPGEGVYEDAPVTLGRAARVRSARRFNRSLAPAPAVPVMLAMGRLNGESSTDLRLAGTAGLRWGGSSRSMLFRDTVKLTRSHGRSDQLARAFNARGSPRDRGLHFAQCRGWHIQRLGCR